MTFVHHAMHFFFQLDRHLNAMAANLGPWLYPAIFAGVFSETGFVFLPLVPGESLVFSASALAASPDSVINPWLLAVASFLGAVAGDFANYGVAVKIGGRLFRRKSGWFFTERQRKLAKSFFDQYGGKALILGRFVAFVRDITPFMAGVGQMAAKKSFKYISISGAAWAVVFSLGGYLLGKTPMIRDHFHRALILIAVVALVPAIVEYVRVRKKIRT